MKRIAAALLLCTLLFGCAAQEPALSREEALCAHYIAAQNCTATVRAAVVTQQETLTCTLAVERQGEELAVTVLEPEEIAGVRACVHGDDVLSLEYDGMVFDALSLSPDVSAVNCAALFLRAVTEGAVVERGTESFAEEDRALRLCFALEHAGKTLHVAAYFDEADVPMYAEIEDDGKILAYLEFTSFSFNDILQQTAP